MAKGRWSKTQRLLDAAKAVLESEWPATVRQLFYRLVSILVIENCIEDYRRVSSVMTSARQNGEVPWEFIVDRSRPTYQARTYQNLEDYGEVVGRSYRKDYWTNQPWYVEVWCEKDAVIGSVERVTDEFGITLRAIRGFSSTTVAHEVGELLCELRLQGKQIEILYLGDFDPSGMCIENDVARRVKEQMHYHRTPIETLIRGQILDRAFTQKELDAEIERERKGEVSENYIVRKACAKLGLDPKTALLPFAIRRLAIHGEDITRFNLPPLRVKPTDSRTPGFLEQYGAEAVELDALPPSELRRRLRRAIQGKIERTGWQRAMAVEQAERETTRKVAAALRSMQPLPDGREATT